MMQGVQKNADPAPVKLAGPPKPVEPKPVPVIDWATATAPPLQPFKPSTAGFGDCCGMGMMKNFPVSNGYRLDPDVLKSGDYPNYLVILNGAQRSVWHERLLEAGFTVLREGIYNSVHDSLLTLYLYEAYPTRSPDHPDFKGVIYENSVGYRQVTRDGKAKLPSNVKVIPLEDYKEKRA